MARRERDAVRDGLAQLFGDSPDLLAGVIWSDRVRAGRDGQTPAYAGTEPTEHGEPPVHGDTHTAASPVRLDYDKQTDKHTDLPTTAHTDSPTHTPACNQAHASVKRKRPQEPNRLRAERLAEADRLAAGPTLTVTLRLPQAFNAWLDEYVHRSWPVRIRKQELLGEALRLLFVHRGRAGEPLLLTDWLDSKEP